MGSDDELLKDPQWDKFRIRIAYLQTWAAAAASRAGDLSYEWPAVACAFTALYVLFVIPQANTLTFIDVVIVFGVMGTGYMLNRFERNSGMALAELARQLAPGHEPPTELTEDNHVPH